MWEWKYARTCKGALKEKAKQVHVWRMYHVRNDEVRGYLRDVPLPELTKADKEEIDEYWAQFGIKIKNYNWFRWFEGISGIKSPKFIPDDIWFDTVLLYYSDRDYLVAYFDKNHFDMYLPDVPFPEVVYRRMAREFRGPDGKYIQGDAGELTELLLEAGDVIVKNSRETGLGRSVKKYSVRTKEDAAKLLSEWDRSHYIVQRCIKQHPFFAQFNSSSVNAIRFTSWYHDGEVDIAEPYIRIGTPGFVTDIAIVNGKEKLGGVGVTEDGYLKNRKVSLDQSPVTIAVPKERIPCWDKILQIIRDNAPKLRGTDIVGWDISVTEDEKPVVIEYNIGAPGIASSEISNGPLFGEKMDLLLSFLKDKENQKKYIPSWLRL